jgi:hypothetical protein
LVGSILQEIVRVMGSLITFIIGRLPYGSVLESTEYANLDSWVYFCRVGATFVIRCRKYGDVRKFPFLEQKCF